MNIIFILRRKWS